ncbi:MAG: hypothetical protein H6672_19930 [Anaerolineaceae bacterium]|nr:hypothetical protein [Anaerolineaceae bacterium]
MRYLTIRLGLVAVVVALLSVGFFTVSAQDSSGDMMMGSVVCDSDLILNLYVAENYFGFGAVMDHMMMAEGGDMMGLDLTTYDKGQYAGLFDTMMGMMDENMMAGSAVLSEEQMATVTEYMGMGMDGMMNMMGDAAMMDGMTTLVPAAVADEAPECTALRAELNLFYTAIAYSESMMMSSEG